MNSSSESTVLGTRILAKFFRKINYMMMLSTAVSLSLILTLAIIPFLFTNEEN